MKYRRPLPDSPSKEQLARIRIFDAFRTGEVLQFSSQQDSAAELADLPAENPVSPDLLKIGQFLIHIYPKISSSLNSVDKPASSTDDSLFLVFDDVSFSYHITQENPKSFASTKKVPKIFRVYPTRIKNHILEDNEVFQALKSLQNRKQILITWSSSVTECTKLIDVVCSVYLTEKGISRVKFATDFPKCSKDMQILFKTMLQVPDQRSDNNNSSKDDFDQLYADLTKIRLEKSPDFYSTPTSQQNEKEYLSTLNNDGLIPKLRNYQENAVRWMLWREKSINIDEHNDEFFDKNLYKEIVIGDQQLYYNAYFGVLVREKPTLASPPLARNKIRGGILADEMGLGKTVEMLTLILNHRQNSDQLATMIISQDDESSTTNICKRLLSESDPDYYLNNNKRRKFSRNNDIPLKTRRAVKRAAHNKRMIDDDSSDISCSCDKLYASVNKDDRITCGMCRSVQHKKCVNWPSENVEDYLCPRCCAESVPIECKTTLIISPNTICAQWVDEIKKHVHPGVLKVFIYNGLVNCGFIQPKFLADFDIVITTYETLRNELNYVDLPNERRFRRTKRFSTFPSPITCLKWWRICLDEAQMVEKASKAAEMCRKIESVYRWCITGTPLQKSVQDFYGLLLFVDSDNIFVDKRWWNIALTGPYFEGEKIHLLNTIAPYFWRSAKKDVFNQLKIPEQSIDVCWIEFGPVEEHFYRRTREKCSQEMRPILSEWPDLNQKLDSLDRQTLEKFMKPLLKLRQACNHPQIMHENFWNLNKLLLTIEEVLEKMINKTKRECEEEHRIIVSDYNGLAGLQQLKKMYDDAYTTYRRVLDLCVEHKNSDINTDKLQMVHALRNLLELNVARGPNLASRPTPLENISLKTRIDNVEGQYLEKSIDPATRAIKAMQTAKKFTLTALKETEDAKYWWLSIDQAFESAESLNQTIWNHFVNVHEFWRIMADKGISLFAGIKLWLTERYDDLFTIRNKVIEILNDLIKESNDPNLQRDLLESASECHLRFVGRQGCIFCNTNRLLEAYEAKLFLVDQERTLDDVEYLENGDPAPVSQVRLANDSQLEQCLKHLLRFLVKGHANERVRSATALRGVISAARRHLKIFADLKREYPAFTAVWTTQSTLIAARDELSMAATKFRFKNPAEQVGPNDVHIIEENEVDAQMERLTVEKAMAEFRLKRKFGQLEYLMNLRKLENSGEGNTTECPICGNSLGFRWSMFICGHSFCEDCTVALINTGRSNPLHQPLRCAVCRQEQSVNMISFVTSRKCWEMSRAENNDNSGKSNPAAGHVTSTDDSTATIHNQVQQQPPNFVFHGSYSSKIEAVCRKLFYIAHSKEEVEAGEGCPVAKSLVFSNWPEVLRLLAKALQDNRIRYLACYTSKQLPLTLHRFKKSLVYNVLLIPTSFGANGLNIVEANHVLLVDPLLNPSVEQQVLGRVHRIGQTKRTYVHRFITRGTVEEKLYKSLGDLSPEKFINENQSPLTIADFVDFVQD